MVGDLKTPKRPRDTNSALLGLNHKRDGFHLSAAAESQTEGAAAPTAALSLNSDRMLPPLRGSSI
jgi:hypothetical protein